MANYHSLSRKAVSAHDKNARKEIRTKARWSKSKGENIKSDISKPAPILAQKPNFGANFNRFKQDLNSGKFTLKAGHIKAPTMKKQPLKTTPLFENGQPLKERFLSVATENQKLNK